MQDLACFLLLPQVLGKLLDEGVFFFKDRCESARLEQLLLEVVSSVEEPAEVRVVRVLVLLQQGGYLKTLRGELDGLGEGGRFEGPF